MYADGMLENNYENISKSKGTWHLKC